MNIFFLFIYIITKCLVWMMHIIENSKQLDKNNNIKTAQ